MTDEPTIKERVAASRAAQGLPPVITDPATIERVAAILLAAELNPDLKMSPARLQPARGTNAQLNQRISIGSGTPERSSGEAAA